MAKDCKCPLEFYPDLSNPDCGIKWDQVVAFAIQKPQDPAYFADIPALQTEANWNTALAAEDDTKMVIIKLNRALVIPASEPDYFEDDTNIGGLARYRGQNSVTVTGTLENIDLEYFKALDDLSCFGIAKGGSSQMTAYFFNDYSKIIHLTDEDSNLLPEGIPIYNFNINSPGNDGTDNTDNIFTVSFQLKGEWFRNIQTTDSPNFNPTSLQNQ